MTENLEARLLAVMTRHVGRSRAIGMDRLHAEVYGDDPKSKINGTRGLRKIITRLRAEGVPILSVSSTAGGGYYLASAGSELDVYLGRLRRRALGILAIEARIRKTSVGELLGQMQLNLEG